MEIAKSAPATSFSSLTRTVTKILRFRRSSTTTTTTTTTTGGFNGDDENHKVKLKLSEYQPGVADFHFSTDGSAKEKPQLEELHSNCNNRIEPDIDSLLANIFAGISSIKAAYAQLQVAESPYDPDTIQESDQTVVSELRRLSSLKQSYIKKHQFQAKSPADSQVMPPQLQEQRSLLKTYQITTGKLETGLRHLDAELQSLQTRLLESEYHNHSLESQLRHGHTLFFSGDLHLSEADPKYLIATLRLALKSVRSFVKQMVREMESAGWDLDAAAGAIQPDVRGRPEHWIYAFESFVCQTMFAHFQHRDFGIPSLGERSFLDRQRFFQEFVDLNSSNLAQAGVSELETFLQSKYLSLVHPKMEASFFGDLRGRTAIGSGLPIPETEFFALFAKMAKRVWLLHCLYSSYVPELEAAIFQVKRGCRFSEVYMDSVTASPAHVVAGSSAVKFTVVPGFRVGKTLIQCKVYLSKEG